MPPRNPSELARLEEELEYHLSIVRDTNSSKKIKEHHLKLVREVENILGITGKTYNSSEFGK